MRNRLLYRLSEAAPTVGKPRGTIRHHQRPAANQAWQKGRGPAEKLSGPKLTHSKFRQGFTATYRLALFGRTVFNSLDLMIQMSISILVE